MIQSLTKHKPVISAFLKNFLTEKKQQYKNHFWAEDYFSRLEKYMLGGKTIRGSLVIALYEIFAEDKKNNPEVIKIAVAIELLQAALLMHDDILDKDELRRGSPSMHMQYKNLAEKNGYSDPKHFGSGITICGGDIVFGLCFSLIADLQVSPKISSQLQVLFSQELVCVALAEAHDFEMAFTNREISKNEILDMYLNKTGRYSLSLPIMAGAIMAGQSQPTLGELEKIGENLGIIFQIKDDEMGIFGDEKETGKPSGNDIREGKKTLFWYYLLEYGVFSMGYGEDFKRALDFFGKKSLTEKNIEFVRRIIKKSEILEKVNEDVKKLADLFYLELEKLEISTTGRKFFEEFLEFSKNRNK